MAPSPSDRITIVKVQGSAAKGPWLVTDQAREHQVMQQPTPEMREVGPGLKGFFEAAWSSETQTWRIGRKVEDQTW